MASHPVMEIIVRGGVVPIVRLPSLDRAEALAQALIEAGVTSFEVTLTSPGALETLHGLLERLPSFADGTAAIGAGSIVSAAQAEAALDAGAQFIVTPVTYPEAIAVCVKRGAPIIPGALTPTEIQTAWDLGASAVKVFPAHHFGPVYLKDILAPLPHLKLVPTGGITPQNAADYIRHGAVALGAGSNLVNPKWVDAGDWQAIGDAGRAYLAAVQAGRAKS